MVKANSHLTALGRTIFRFAELERALSFFIRRTFLDRLNPDEQVIILNHLSFRRQLDLLGALFIERVKDKKLLAELRITLTKLATAESLRNQLMHSQWELPTDDFPRTVARYKVSSDRSTGLKHNFEEMTLNHFRKAIRTFDAAESALRKFEQRFWNWRYKRRTQRK
jgi:hypothetical protein